MLLPSLLLAASLLILVAGAELLVRGAAGFARRLGVSSFFIGLTIVGFGTSSPELATSLISALGGHDDIAVGNVVGSNIFNIALILGLTAMIAPIPIRVDLVRKEVLLVIAVAVSPYVALLTDGVLQRWAGAFLVAALVVYIWRGYINGRRQAADDAALEAEIEVASGLTVVSSLNRSLSAQIVLCVLGIGLLVGGSALLVDSGVEIARGLGISELVIGLTIIAGGTSAPELVTSLVAAIRKQSDISVGNILGSNIFNILGILGITCVVTPQTLHQQVLWLDAPVMIAASVACLPIMMSAARISRTEGALLLAAYIAYLTVLFLWAPGWFAAG